MFRPIRKVKREISIEAAKQLLKNERRGVLAVQGDDGYPYAMPINFIYDENDNRIYFHGALAGHKIDSIKKCDKVCFTVYGNESIKEEEWAPYVQSAIVFGRCHLTEDRERMIELVRKMAMKYYPDESIADYEIGKYGNAFQMFEIEIEHLSGKEIQEK